jgi:predicted aspartyl protease
MSPRINFTHEFQYRELEPFGYLPVLDITLIGPEDEDDLLAIVDTGARYCLFDGRRATAIGLDLLDGRAENLSGLAGNLLARIHTVTLEILGVRFKCEVAFSEQEIRRELLGRHTLFNRVRFGFREGMNVGYFHPEP